MAWTATLDSVTTDRGNVVAVVTFTDDATGERLTEKVGGDTVTADYLAGWVWSRIESLKSRDAAKTTLRPGPIVPVKPVSRVV